MNRHMYNKLAQDSIAGWRARQARLNEEAHRKETIQQALDSEVLPGAQAPSFDEDEERPMTAQGRALRAARAAR